MSLFKLSTSPLEIIAEYLGTQEAPKLLYLLFLNFSVHLLDLPMWSSFKEYVMDPDTPAFSFIRAIVEAKKIKFDDALLIFRRLPMPSRISFIENGSVAIADLANIVQSLNIGLQLMIHSKWLQPTVDLMESDEHPYYTYLEKLRVSLVKLKSKLHEDLGKPLQEQCVQRLRWCLQEFSKRAQTCEIENIKYYLTDLEYHRWVLVASKTVISIDALSGHCYVEHCYEMPNICVENFEEFTVC